MIRNFVRAVCRQWLSGAAALLATLIMGLFFIGAPVSFTARAGVVLRPMEESSLQKQTQRILSDAVLERAVREDDEDALDPETLKSRIEQLRAAVIVSRAEGSPAVEIRTTSLAPGRAVARVNAVGQAFASAADLSRRESERVLEGIDAALKKRAVEAARLETRLTGAPRTVPIGTDPAAARLADIDRSLAANRAEAEALAVRIEVLTGRLERGDVDPAGRVDTAESDRLSRELAAARRRLEELRKSEGENAPGIPGLAARVEILKRERDEAARLEGLEARFAPTRDLLDRIRETSTRLKALERSAVELEAIRRKLAGPADPRPDEKPATAPASQAELEAELEWVRATAADLRALRARLASEQNLAADPVERFDPARSAALASAPILYLLLAGLVVGLVVAYGVEAWTPTIRTDHDISRYVNLPLLGIVPAARPEEDRLLLQAGERAPVLEVFNTMATLVESHAKTDASKVFAVTSAVPEEGKSTVACNLAVALAGGGAQVLLVDADLRRSIQHRLLSTPAEPGLSSYLMGQTDDVEVILKRPAVDNLTLLPAGPLLEAPHPFLHSERFRALVPELRERFDYVVFDLPPVRSVADGLQVAPLVDGVILVISATETGKDDATAAKRLIRASRGRLIGCVLNKATVRSRGYYYYAAASSAAAE